MKPLFVFIHVPKTAGVTFADVLVRNFEGKIFDEPCSEGIKICHWSHKMPEPGDTSKPAWLNYQKGKGDFNKLECIHGHLTYDEFEALECFKDRVKIYFTFLRDPTYRTWSMYHFTQTWNGADKFLKWLHEDTKEHYTQRANAMTYALSGEANPNKSSLELAVKRLSKMTYGITEYFDLSLDKFCREFSYIFKTLKYKKHNITEILRHKIVPEIPTHLRYEIWQANQLDNILYKWALGEFRRGL